MYTLFTNRIIMTRRLTQSFERYATETAVAEGQTAESQDQACSSSSDDEGPQRPPGCVMSNSEKMVMWESKIPYESEAQTFEVQNLVAQNVEAQNLEAHVPEVHFSEGILKEVSLMEKLKHIVFSAFWYKWLLATLRNRLLLVSSDENILKNIRATIFRVLPTPTPISTRSKVPSSRAIFQIYWPLRSFLSDQWSSRQDADQVGDILTLTGTFSEAQALTCNAYLNQTWPLTGGRTLHLIAEVLKTDKKRIYIQSEDANVTAFENGDSIHVEVEGTRQAIVDIAEQLCWLAAALRSSPFTGQLCYCIPRIYSAEFIKTPLQMTFGTSMSNQPPMDSNTIPPNFFKLDVDFMRLDPDDDNRGTCWRQLFGSAVLVRGFPIHRRSQPKLGLEIPLNVAAGLLGTKYINQFDNIAFVKGFSAMLSPSAEIEDLMIWHFNCVQADSYISYLDFEIPKIQINKSAVSYKRHIIGWSQDAKHHVGSANSNYDVGLTNAKQVDSSCALHACSLSPVINVSDGQPYQISKDQYSKYCNSEQLPNIIRRLSNRFVCFWDVQGQRGWLVNGIGALSHLVRASVRSDEDQTPEYLELIQGQFKEPSCPHLFDAPRKFLCDPHNQSTVILKFQHKGSTRTETLEDRAIQYYHILDNAFNYQEKHQARLKCTPRGMLEGWEFYDLIWRRDDSHTARHTTIAPMGKGWIDLLKDIGAITLLGSGFGELMEPSDCAKPLCPAWQTLPTQRFYVATSLPVLQKVMQLYGGNSKAYPRQITESISWLTPAALFDCCGCQTGSAASQLVQVPWPTEKISLLAKTCDVSDVLCNNHSIVVFGHNEIYDWHWPDFGPPLKGPPPPPPITRDHHKDSESGTSASSVSMTLPSWRSQPISTTESSVTTQHIPSAQGSQSQHTYGPSKLYGHTRQINGNIYHITHNTITAMDAAASSNQVWTQLQPDTFHQNSLLQPPCSLSTAPAKQDSPEVRRLDTTVHFQSNERRKREGTGDLEVEPIKKQRLHSARSNTIDVEVDINQAFRSVSTDFDQL